MDLANIISMTAMVASAIYIVYLHHQLDDAEVACEEAEKALEAADQAVTICQQVIVDVARGNATLEVLDNGQIIATHCSAGKVSLH